MSVRFLGRRVYVALAVVVLAVKRNKINAAITELAETLGVTCTRAHDCTLAPMVAPMLLLDCAVARNERAVHATGANS